MMFKQARDIRSVIGGWQLPVRSDVALEEGNSNVSRENERHKIRFNIRILEKKYALLYNVVRPVHGRLPPVIPKAAYYHYQSGFPNWTSSRQVPNDFQIGLGASGTMRAQTAASCARPSSASSCTRAPWPPARPPSTACAKIRCPTTRESATPAAARACGRATPTAPSPRAPIPGGRVKRLRSFPHRLQDLPADVREPLLAEFRIPSGVTKCCSACFNRIQRRLGPVEEWSEEEIGKLKTALTELGANWQLIGERLNKLPHQVRSFYTANRKRLTLEGCLGDRKPTLTDEEESGSSTSSCEEPMRERGNSNSSDTASAAESPPVQGSNSMPIKKEDYDSSATETADEAQTPDHYQGSATITPVTIDGQPRQNTSPLSVKDIVVGVIENSFKKNPTGQQQTVPPGMAPTISSILNNDANEVTIVSEYTLNNMAAAAQQHQQQQRPQVQQRADLNLAKITPLIGATITPVSGPIQAQQQLEPIPSSRDDLIVLQALQQQIHRSEAYIYHQERKSPAFSMRAQPKMPSPKPANPKTGSITLGTPIISQPRGYEGLLRQMPEAKMGSITQGTPIHMPHNMQDKRVYDYFNKTRQGQAPPPQQGPPPGAQYPAQYRQAAYVDQQLSSQQLTSRQIIMNDYITSQQMLARRAEKPQYYPASSPHRTPPPPQMQAQQQQRQGVIQRHTRPQYLQPGHEALSSLVDVAVQQPSLPVPNAPHEGLGKTMADNILEQPHRYQIIQQHQQQLRQQQHQQHQQQQQRLEEQRRAAFHQQAAAQQQARQQARTDSSTLTAASLIDAIITHQINQTAEGGREVVASTREQRAGDLLFQNFHRGEPPQQQDGVGPPDHPQGVMSVDLDGDALNKNLTVKELTDSVISHDFGARAPANYYHLHENMNEQWKRRMQQHKEEKRAHTPQQQQQQQDERQIIRIAQPQQQKYHIERVEPVSPPENNHWSEQNFRRYQQPQSHISPLDYVKNRIVEDGGAAHPQDKDRSDSPGDMVIDEEKHDQNEYKQQQQQQQQGGFYSYVHKDNTANENSRNNEPKPLLSAQLNVIFTVDGEERVAASYSGDASCTWSLDANVWTALFLGVGVEATVRVGFDDDGRFYHVSKGRSVFFMVLVTGGFEFSEKAFAI
ncbi:hypothetical protein NQ317_009398 [Molorchus minor]|uniref:Myb-like domain-containing protein n=1 Tax=Molorchus minor TaxID=1323400 RepID=A0ABQ9JQ57_9CUCU|nr:hypothetical protein NQ317_009398 [Molorchus minor]